MTLNIRAVPLFNVSPEEPYITTLIIHLNNPETIQSFKKDVLDRALNCNENSPAEWKELADCIEFGAPLQNYQNHHRFKKSAPEAVVLSEPLPVCEKCGQKGYGHLFNCPVLLKM